MTLPRRTLGLALLVALPAGAAGVEFELPSVAAALESARALARVAPSVPAQKASGLGDRVAAALAAIRKLRNWELSCGGLPLCPPDRIYYDAASVNERVDRALAVVRADRLAQASPEVLRIRGAAKFWGDKLAPARTPLYLAGEVDDQVNAALALLNPGRP